MYIDVSTFQFLMGNSISLSKGEVIRRYRSQSTVNYYMLQILCMLQFTMMGKDEEGKIFFC